MQAILLVFGGGIFLIFFTIAIGKFVFQVEDRFQEWAKRNGYKVVRCEFPRLFKGERNFGWRYVTVENACGQRKIGWILVYPFSSEADEQWES